MAGIFLIRETILTKEQTSKQQFKYFNYGNNKSNYR